MLTLWAVLTVVFFMVRLAPGSPFDAEKALPEGVKERMVAAYGLDRPMIEQYGTFWKNLLQGDLGISVIFDGASVNELIGEAFKVSLALGVWSLGWALIVGLPLGFFWAYSGRKIGQGVFVLGLLPSFVAAPLLQQAILAFGGNAYGYTGFSSLFWPSVVLGFYYMPFVARLTQVGFESQMGALYCRLAQAKGLTRWTVALKHAYRGALSPLLAYLGPTAAGLVTGSFIVESVFGLPGLGRFFVNSVFNRDDPLLLGLVCFYTILLLVFNAVVEALLRLWNPAARQEGGRS